MWPGLVGKGPGSEPFIDLDTMLNLTAMAESDGACFEGVDLFLSDPHISIDSTDDQLKELADKIAAKELAVGSVVAPVWPPTGGGSAMGKPEDRHRFVEQVRKASRIARTLREIGIRPYGVVRIDSATDPGSWTNDPEGSKKIASTFRECCNIAKDHGERLAAEGEICSAANLNSPEQTVISGHAGAVKRTVEIASQLGAKRAVILAVSAPFHSALMAPAQEKLEKDLKQTEFAALRVPLVTNVDADTIETGDEAREALIRQVTAPVRWEESVRLLIDEGVNTFVEVGPGRVLSGLLRQIERSVATLNVEDEKSLAATVEKIAGARSDAA